MLVHILSQLTLFHLGLSALFLLVGLFHVSEFDLFLCELLCLWHLEQLLVKLLKLIDVHIVTLSFIMGLKLAVIDYLVLKVTSRSLRMPILKLFILLLILLAKLLVLLLNLLLSHGLYFVLIRRILWMV